MTRNIYIILSYLIVLTMCISSIQKTNAASQTILILNSQAGDPIGQGIPQTYRPADGNLVVRTLGGSGLQVYFITSDNNHQWFLDFGAPSGLAVGEYEDAQSLGPQAPTRPSFDFGSGNLDVSADSRGCLSPVGRFLISDLKLAADGTVQRLAIDFEQHCDGATPALYGSVRYNSSVSIVPRISIGDVVAQKGSAGTTDASAIVALSMPSKHIVTVQYATADGTAIQGKDYSATSGTVAFEPGTTSQTITIPVVGNRRASGNRAFSANLLSPKGAAIGDGSASVRIYDPNVPMTIMTMNSEPGDFIGGGRSWLLMPVSASRNSENGVSVDAGGPFWFLSMAGPDKSTLVPGTYLNTQRYPFQPAGVPGLDIWGDAHACDTSTGQFTVNQAAYGGDGSVENFSADFEQHCEGAAPALFGSVRVNAIFQQASVTNGAVKGASVRFTVTLNPASTTAATVKFVTLDGTAVAGTDYTSVSRTVTFSPGQTKKVISVPLLKPPSGGKQFFGQLLSTGPTQLWVSTASSRL